MIFSTVSSDVLLYILDLLPLDRDIFQLYTSTRFFQDSFIINRIGLKGRYTIEKCKKHPSFANYFNLVRKWRLESHHTFIPLHTTNLYIINRVNLAALVFPSTIKFLYLGSTNNISNPFILPSRLTVLQLGMVFDYLIDHIVFPDSLTCIDSGGSFNQSIDNVKWPSNLKKLILWNKFNQPILNSKFPISLKELQLGNDFNQEVKNLPEDLQVLRLGRSFIPSIQTLILPRNLKVLQFHAAIPECLMNLPLPITLQELILPKSINSLFYMADQFPKTCKLTFQ